MVGHCTNEACYSRKTNGILRVLVSCFGLPDEVVPDNGPQFAHDFTTYTDVNGI